MKIDMDLETKYKAIDKLYELKDFCLANGFKNLFEGAPTRLSARKGAVKIYAVLNCNILKIVTSTGASESCALSDLRIGEGSLFINGKEFVV